MFQKRFPSGFPEDTSLSFKNITQKQWSCRHHIGSYYVQTGCCISHITSLRMLCSYFIEPEGSRSEGKQALPFWNKLDQSHPLKNNPFQPWLCWSCRQRAKNNEREHDKTDQRRPQNMTVEDLHLSSACHDLRFTANKVPWSAACVVKGIQYVFKSSAAFWDTNINRPFLDHISLTDCGERQPALHIRRDTSSQRNLYIGWN